MQYTGKRTVRLYTVGSYDITNKKDNFLLDNNLMIEFLTNIKYTNKDNVHGKRGKISWDYKDLSERDKVEYFTHEFDKAEIDRLDKINYKGKQYVMFNWGSNENTMTLFEVLPSIYNDEIFSWTYNKKYNTKECVFAFSTFEFYCICDKDNNVQIDVKYAKCDNRHSNRVTLTTIKVNDASNQAILEAVNFWRDEFISEIQALA